jgi:hypothetical protein
MERCIICYQAENDDVINHRPFCPEYAIANRQPKKDKRKKKK